jgi:cytochrome c biogenesis protein CcdA/thiol-disulfide isomerase/thioredoxin
MLELIIVGFVAGIVAGVSPCIIPVLPVVLVAGATTPSTGGSSWRARARPVAVVAGLVVSFSLLILAGSEVLSLLHLPQDLLRNAGIVVLVLVGLGLLFPALGTLLERPFARVAARQPPGGAGGFVVGLALGLLFVPCAGPVLAAITVVGATDHVGPAAVVLTVAFAAGAAVPLLAVALAGHELTARVKALRQQGRRIRQVSGVVLIVMATAVAFNAFDGLQTDVPGYTSALQKAVEGSATVRRRLSALTGTGSVPLTSCDSNATGLVNCGAAPGFAGITAWLNTPGSSPLTISGLKGKVVLVDFWTYSCINCQRTLPHVEAWYSKYAADGLEVVGVHTPEFSFEHDPSNVRAEAASLGVRYPVAIDDNYATWNAYGNEYWPAEYLIDATGVVRHVHFGESQYSDTEGLIRQLLADAHPGVSLPAASDLPDKTPSGQTNPETYVGYQQLQYLVPSNQVTRDAPAPYHFPTTLPLGGLGLSGTWTERSEEATAGAGARLELGFQARDIYLVMAGSGTVDVSVNGAHTQTVSVGGVPKLYTLAQGASIRTGVMLLAPSPGVEVYDFTFG